jgi:hypothetical protein
VKHVPQRMTYGELADILSELAGMVRGLDSLEGSVEWLIGDGPGVDVRARFRIGNREGQGGMRFIGDLLED